MNIVHVYLNALLYSVCVSGFQNPSDHHVTCIAFAGSTNGVHNYETEHALFKMEVFLNSKRIVRVDGNDKLVDARGVYVQYYVQTKNSTFLAKVVVSNVTTVAARITNQEYYTSVTDRLLAPEPQICLPAWVLEGRLRDSPYSRTFWEMAGSQWETVRELYIELYAGSVPAPWLALLRLPKLQILSISGAGWPRPHELKGPLPALLLLLLKSNGIVDLPDDFFESTPVGAVNLLGNPLPALPRALALNAALWKLEVGGPALYIPPEDATALQQLQSFTVRGSSLRPDTATALLRLPHLLHLEISDCGLESFAEPLAPINGPFDEVILTRNKLSSLPPDFSTIPGIGLFDGSYNDFTHCPFENLNKPMNISKVDLRYNKIDTLTKKCILNLNGVTEFEVSQNRIKSIEPNTFSHLQILRKIFLTGNFLTHIERDTFFIQSKRNPLEVISLKNNLLRNVTIVNSKESVLRLEVLDVADNDIENFEAPSADVLVLRNTSTREITPTMLDYVESGRFGTVDFGSNPLLCCRHNQSAVGRVVALQERKVIRNNLTDAPLHCSLPDVGMLTFGEFEEHREACGAAERARALAWSIAWAVQGLLAFVVAVILYRRRSDLSYARAFLRARRLDPEDNNRYATCVYDAFVCYSSNNTDWVTNEFVPTLENHKRQYKFCVHHHDFTLGLPIAENIMLAMKRSRKVIFILTQQFVESEWGAWELHLAAHRMLGAGRDYLLLVLLEDLRGESVPPPLRLLLATRTFVRWPAPAAPQRLQKKCYQRLVAALGESLWQRTGKDPRRPGTVSDLT